MGTQNTLQTVLMVKTSIILTAFGGMPSVADASKSSHHTRIAHAKELLVGAAYRKGSAKKAESLKDMTEFVQRITAEWLPEKYAKKSKSVAAAIMGQSEKYGFDPIFVLAVIQNESRFDPEMRGNHTEIGLMQIKPTTAAWVAKKMNLKYKGEKSLLNPVENIKIGTAFMSMLRDQFDSHSRLYISAYNMGARRVRQIVAEDRMPKDYVQAVMKRYVAIYSAFNGEDISKEDADALASRALDRVRVVTRSVASNN